MKNSILYFLCFSIIGTFAQDSISEKNSIANTEKTAAAKLMNLTVNPNTQNYDVTYHKLEFTVNPANYFISGKVTTTYTALSNMITLTFDLSTDLTVSSVKINNSNLVFSQNTNELIITLANMQVAQSQATVEVIYSGVPPQNGFNAFTSSTHGNPA
ncbi:MAG: peptidase M1, partial [Flavobacteriaceae bacterium]|nr:peptidase M1 [Flavobacteriaceae bacterium]